MAQARKRAIVNGTVSGFDSHSGEYFFYYFHSLPTEKRGVQFNIQYFQYSPGSGERMCLNTRFTGSLYVTCYMCDTI